MKADVRGEQGIHDLEVDRPRATVEGDRFLVQAGQVADVPPVVGLALEVGQATDQLADPVGPGLLEPAEDVGQGPLDPLHPLPDRPGRGHRDLAGVDVRSGHPHREPAAGRQGQLFGRLLGAEADAVLGEHVPQGHHSARVVEVEQPEPLLVLLAERRQRLGVDPGVVPGRLVSGVPRVADELVDRHHIGHVRNSSSGDGQPPANAEANPPSGWSNDPVKYEPSSLTRNSAVWAISNG